MKKSLLLLCMVVIAFTSCKKVLSKFFTIQKNLDFTESVDIPAIPGTGTPFPAQGITISFPRFATATNSKAFLEENKTSGDLVTSVKASKLNLLHISPAAGAFTYIDSLKLYVSAPGIGEQLVAYNYNITKGSKEVVMTVADIELRTHFLTDSIFYRLEGHFYDYPDSNSKVEMNATFTIKANPIQ